MAGSTLRAVRSEARAISVPVPALAVGDPTGSAVLALDLGQKTGWRWANVDRPIASNMAGFEVGRFEHGHGFPAVRAWLEEVDEIARSAGAALALLYWTLAQGGRR